MRKIVNDGFSRQGSAGRQPRRAFDHPGLGTTATEYGRLNETLRLRRQRGLEIGPQPRDLPGFEHPVVEMKWQAIAKAVALRSPVIITGRISAAWNRLSESTVIDQVGARHQAHRICRANLGGPERLRRVPDGVDQPCRYPQTPGWGLQVSITWLSC